ncbi:dinuclear metal center YbgI/SA1388 family protein [Methanolinea mesophila]|uniref:Nif3-like dinuclear metal center hexameric protein n=1 Tax=Methanolinea mesophila TaxID=547055 RepID=UPI001AE614C1|nr:Nif3-like dinuclear metal center hexameric protein [Methanolinea mesophila]MBP1929660.1 dinuclear metal center YbgI/SA1388 family protein [Methanolinea mesophila]
MEREAVIRHLEALAPPELAEEFDAGRIGLVVEGREETGSIYCALDASPRVVEKALLDGTDMLVVHHTPIWAPVTKIDGDLAAFLRGVLRSGMNVYVLHTNFDHAPGGVNDVLAEMLRLSDIIPLSLGLVGDCPLSISEISGLLGVPLRVWGELETVSRLAVVGGSGFDPLLIREAYEQGADAFLSAELKHSVARAAPIPLIEATHYSLEAPAMRELARRFGWNYIDDPPALSLWTSGN